jgi:hypothetical protein
LNVYQKELESENYANLYFPWLNLWINIWDTYIYDTKTYTVLNIINNITKSWYILYCSYNWDNLIWKPKWIFTRTSWTWEASLYVNLVRYWYKLLNTFKDTTKVKFSSSLVGSFNETRFALEVWSFDESVTPEIYDFNLYFDEVNND